MKGTHFRFDIDRLLIGVGGTDIK